MNVLLSREDTSSESAAHAERRRICRCRC